jgi:DNA-directed RNA polymerase specialized sigma24 family protein
MTQFKRRRRRFRSTVGTFLPYLRRTAHRYARGDLDLEDDLVQEGMVALWRIDPLRVRGRAGRSVEFIRRVIVSAQIDFARRQVRHGRGMLSISQVRY